MEMQQDSNKIPDMISVREAANRTGLSYDYLRKSCLAGRIIHVRVGHGKFLINFDWLVEWLNTTHGEE